MLYMEKDEPIDIENLERFAQSEGGRLMPFGNARGSAEARRVIDALRGIHYVQRRITLHPTGRICSSGAAEWLLDNWYLAQREGLGAARELKAAGRLRGVGKRRALIMELAEALVRSGGGAVTKERIEVFLMGFQKSRVLTRAELACLISAIKAALVLLLAELAAHLLSEDSGEALAEAVGAVFTSLRVLATVDLSCVIERVDLTEGILRRDPSGVYTKMDERTRDSYRREVSRLAKRFGAAEHKIAQRVLKLAENSEGCAGHVGYYLFTKPLGKKARRSRGGVYIAANILVTLGLTFAAGFASRSAALALLLLFPLSELVKNAVDFVILRLISPRHVPRMELAEGIPPQGRTMAVISTLLTSEKSGAEFARLLEEYRLANLDAGEELLLGILTDLPESHDEKIEGSDEWIRSAESAVDALNEKYGGGFYFLLRERVFLENDGRWMGYERKRGAIISLMRLIAGGVCETRCESGDFARLCGVKYVITLDADTRLLPGVARELAAAMLHPLNTPVIDEKRKIVVAGAGIISPRMSVELPSAGKTDFARIFAGQGGIDPYGCAAGEVYMDLYSRGGFAGKGIIDVNAYLTCLEGKIPDNLVLSHDLIEGMYLRGAYMNDVELSDSCPGNVLSYYARMDRWTRGDWQNSLWLFRRDVTDIDKFKVFDNLRRSLVPPMTFLAVAAGFLVPEGTLALSAAAALLSAASDLLITLTDTALRRESRGKIRYHSNILHGLGGGFLRTFTQLFLLPYEAYVCARAIVFALWRMLVSKKKLLSWQTAAQSEMLRGENPMRYYSKMWMCPLSALAVMLLSGSVFAIAAGSVWSLSPLFAMALGRERLREWESPEKDREYLMERAREIWAFFCKYTNAEDNYLPPDNVQEQPPSGIAHRTSPTNIGLSMLSALVAMKLGIAEEWEAVRHIERILDAVERLEKWSGHILNWYDTRTLAPLHPAYISAVDSGNFAGCLITAAEALAELGQDDLAARCSALVREMDFRPLYDTSRRLFYIGRNLEEGEPSNGWYDLLSSEARLLSYIAVAKGDVPRRHWRRLGRAMLGQDGYRGMASWSGTMFEYLMPELLMPLYRNSLLFETAKFCVYVQKRRAPRRGVWGVSESAFYALDSSLSYRYKAHGCSALALKRGMDSEYVVSPYSSFLALAVDPVGAVKNMRRLEKLGALGKFGFYDAVDFTASRVGGNAGEVVKTVMAHHAGMSLAAISNYLCHGELRRYFMKSPSMAAHASLLQEKVPIGGILLRRQGNEPPAKPLRVGGGEWSAGDGEISWLSPQVTLLSNGAYHLLCAENGVTRAHVGGILPYRSPYRAYGEGGFPTMFLFAAGETRSLLPEPGGEAQYGWSFSSNAVQYTSRGADYEARYDIMVSQRHSGELRRVNVNFPDGAPYGAEIVLQFEPVLADGRDYIGHPAFYKWGIEAASRENSLILRRLRREKNAEMFLCLASDLPLGITTSREQLPGRGGMDAILREQGEYKPGWLYDPMVTACVRPLAKEGKSLSARFALCLGATEDEACEGALSLLAMEDSESANLPAAAASFLKMDIDDYSAAMGLASALAFPASVRTMKGGAAAEGLWRFGISGELPVMCAKVEGETMDAEEKLLRNHALLSSCGLPFDLVFLTNEGGEYRRPQESRLYDALRRLGWEGVCGVRGGVHIVNISRGAEELIASADVVLDLAKLKPVFERVVENLPNSCGRGYPKQRLPQYRFNDDASFSFEAAGSLPPRAWGNMLTNGSFGYFATDCGTGHMWYKNARECRINRWLNDSLATVGTETLEMVSAEGERVSLFASPRGEKTAVTYDFGTAAWEKKVGGATVRTTAFVPNGVCARVFIIESEAAGSVLWKTDIVLGGDERDSLQTETHYENGAIYARNTRSPYKTRPFAAVASREPVVFTCDRSAWLRGEMHSECGMGYDPVMSALYPIDGTLVIVCGMDDEEKLRVLAEPKAARESLRLARERWREMSLRLVVKTPDPALDRIINGWTTYQTAACRVMGRTSLYQSGGAFGFRDQLQDLVNLIPVMPHMARSHIVNSCAHQYAEGDVMHWWHTLPGGAKGVRTRCSDDLVWLPWALCEYVEKTGDIELCGKAAPYLRSAPLEEGERERYEKPELSDEVDSVLGHARRALDLAISRGCGEHGLSLIGTGDWNDGFDNAGAQGRGESVWLTWFISHTARRLAEMVDRCGDSHAAARYRKTAVSLGKAADEAWSGDWYLRGYYDDGSPIGAAGSRECEIDSIAQSFSVWSEESSGNKREVAVKSAIRRLFDRERGIVKLFAPPFENDDGRTGYIGSYGPGFRENGGQYTHGALWLCMAALRIGMPDEAYAMLSAMNPSLRDTETYGAEPYVIPADVYYSQGHEGRAGWSWYTGSAGWYFRVVVEEMLGIKLRDGRLCVEPNLPCGWESYSAVYKAANGAEYKIEVAGGEVMINGKKCRKGDSGFKVG